MKPPIPLYDARFVYVPSHKSDIRERFARERARIAAVKPAKPANVRPITKRKEA